MIQTDQNERESFSYEHIQGVANQKDQKRYVSRRARLPIAYPELYQNSKRFTSHSPAGRNREVTTFLLFKNDYLWARIKLIC